MSKTLKSFKPGSPIQGSYHYTELRTLSAGNVNAHPLQSYTSFSFLYSPAFINTLFLFPQTLLSSKLMVLFSQNLNRLLEFFFSLLHHALSPFTFLFSSICFPLGQPPPPLYRKQIGKPSGPLCGHGKLIWNVGRGTELGARQPESRP